MERDAAGTVVADPHFTFEAKLQVPVRGSSIIPRTALVERMLSKGEEQVVSVVAPLGYGKTTVLAQWAALQGRNVAWVSIDEGDNDPARLLASVAVALSRAGHLDAATVSAVVARSTSIPRALHRLGPMLGRSRGSVALVLDHIDALDDAESLDVIGQLPWRLPAGSCVALVSRNPLPISTPLLRSQGNLVEIGIDDLAMDAGEAANLFDACGVRLEPVVVAALVEQTEGWPVGLYLAALALRSDDSAARRQLAFTGDDLLIADYLRAEVLANLPPITVSFLTRTAVLEHLCGPLCDAVLDTRGSAKVLEELAASNLLLVPLDRRREWYRYHRLFRDVLVAALQRSEPDLVPSLHGRAARWLEANESPEAAISHAQHSGDASHVARLTATTVQPAYAAGRATAARKSCDWFRTRGLLHDHPQIAVLGAWLEALCGSVASAEAWTAIAEAGPTAGVLPDGSRLEGWHAYLRAVLLRDGPARMRTDAELAQELLPPGSRLRAGIRFYEGLSHVLEGDEDAGERVLVHAYDLGMYMGALPSASTAIAERAVIAVGRKEWDDAKHFVERSLQLVDTGHLEDYPGSGLAFAVGARVAIHRGDLRSADDLVIRAARLRPLFTYALPATALIQLELARAYVELNDPRLSDRARRDAGDLSPAARPRGPPGAGRPARRPRRHRPSRPARSIVVDQGGAAPVALPKHPPLVPRDRAAPVRLAPHGEDTGDRGLPQAGRVLSQRSRRLPPRQRPPLTKTMRRSDRRDRPVQLTATGHHRCPSNLVDLRPQRRDSHQRRRRRLLHADRHNIPPTCRARRDQVNPAGRARERSSLSSTVVRTG